ncbi:FtsX-like permease family protein [Bifidobacterium aerophilum]|uniref:ABC transporter permease n=1 Tax=Bifidobacterium aerophilum TaxID=1798155 RepID=A0A6N9Z472_9BIFI|nr:FtsX-like permease family protein [Bifidobacterium aerophilum]NEG89467.1 ABC transporter permease [Bifidobacterium aerophilum]
MSTFALWRLFHRPGTRGTAGRTSVLAIIAFAAATAIFLTVLGGVHGFVWRASADHTLGCMIDETVCRPGTVAVWHRRLGDMHDPAMYASVYVMLAAFACMLLVVPFVALAGSAARLAASRRDARLAALRLAGATTGQVVGLTALDAAGQAFVGSLIGVIGYVILMPVIMLLRFQNQRFDFEQLWVGSLALVATIAGVTVLALVSALLTLRRVAITPLGVTARTASPLPGAWRAAVFAVCVAAAIVVFKNPFLFRGAGDAVIYSVVFGFIALCFALVNLVGTWVIAVRARARARRPKDAATMIAMRRILDDPKRAWRNVSGIALAVFVAGITSICGFLGSGGAGGMGVAADPASANDPSVLFLRDIGTGGLLTLAFAAVLAAVSSGVMQAGSVYDQADEYRMLMLEGTDAATLGRARFAEVFTPLNVVVVVAGGCSMLLMLPLFAASMTDPATLLSFVGGIVLCYALVAVGAFASNRVAARLNLNDYRADD